MDQSEWKSFLTKWKMNRISHRDDFQAIWKKRQNDLKVEEPSSLTDKEEEDEFDAADDVKVQQR